MADEQISMPSSQGGLVRYFNEYKSKVQIKPIHVVAFAVAVIVIELLLKVFTSA
ncbi:preprotein translocase subunit Sec61beta [Candidatus Woesearchaeota archaeon]|nr:preprotein translocase subunit Sec61beta [Candidatus Woesearchaeota archaeon]